MHYEQVRDQFLISTDRELLDLDVIHGYLTRSYWATGVPRHLVEKAVRHCLPFGVYENRNQIGFARVITDFTAYGYFADVFILEACQGRGLGIWLVKTIMAHPDLQGLRKWQLSTADAHGLYRKFGFDAPEHPEWIMERLDSRHFSAH